MEAPVADPGRGKLQFNTVVKVDLSHIRGDNFCPYCHNFSLTDHGPAPQFASEATSAIDYFTAAWSPEAGEIRRLEYHAYFYMTLDDLQQNIGNGGCRFCHVILECVQAIDKGLGEYYSCSIKLLVGNNVILGFAYGKILTSAVQISSVELYVSHGVYPIPEFGKAIKEPSEYCDESSINFLLSCLESCGSIHKQIPICVSSSERLWPARLLCISENAEGISLRLVRTSFLLTSTRYTALSYCWGEYQQLLTLSRNIVEHERGIPMAKLPKLFQDAVDLTLRIGVSHLWIDSLCILQDSDEDWATESSKMGKIYEHALVVVAASRAGDSSASICGPSAVNDLSHIEFILWDEDQQDSTSLHARLFNDTGENFLDPLQKRAWAYQESLLATRVMTFTSRGVFWSCAGAWRSEIYFEDYAIHKSTMTLKGGFFPVRSWDRVVHDYSSRSITYFKDKLPAFSGIAGWWAQNGPEKSHLYLAGLWLETIERDLSWYTFVILSGSSSVKLNFASEDFSAPSWSWASLDGPIIYFNFDDTLLYSYISVVGHDVQPSTSNPFGEVKNSSHLRILGYPIQGVLKRSLDGSVRFHLQDGHDGISLFMIQDCQLLVRKGFEHSRTCVVRARLSDESELAVQKEWQATAYMLPISQSKSQIKGLVLGESMQHPGSFERIGLAMKGVKDSRGEAFERLIKSTERREISLF